MKHPNCYYYWRVVPYNSCSPEVTKYLGNVGLKSINIKLEFIYAPAKFVNDFVNQFIVAIN